VSAGNTFAVSPCSAAAGYVDTEVLQLDSCTDGVHLLPPRHCSLWRSWWASWRMELTPHMRVSRWGHVTAPSLTIDLFDNCLFSKMHNKSMHDLDVPLTAMYTCCSRTCGAGWWLALTLRACRVHNVFWCAGDGSVSSRLHRWGSRGRVCTLRTACHARPHTLHDRNSQRAPAMQVGCSTSPSCCQ
jgi:hypothetical protein